MKLFVYGIFLDGGLREAIFNREVQAAPATLENYTFGPLVYGRFKGIVKRNGEKVEGMILDLNDREIDTTDRIEGNGYRRIGVGIGRDYVQVYVPV